MTLLCERCGQEFTDPALYKQHKTDHMLGRVGDKSVDELLGSADRVESKVSQQAQPSPIVANTPKPPAPWQQAATQIAQKGVILEYKYSGNCPNCSTQIETIVLEGVAPKGKVVAIAWCTRCKEQRQQQIVQKLPVSTQVATSQSGEQNNVKNTFTIPQAEGGGLNTSTTISTKKDQDQSPLQKITKSAKTTLPSTTRQQNLSKNPKNPVDLPGKSVLIARKSSNPNQPLGVSRVPKNSTLAR